MDSRRLGSKGGEAQGQAEGEVALVSRAFTHWEGQCPLGVLPGVTRALSLLGMPLLWLAYSTPQPGLLWPSPGLSPALQPCAPKASDGSPQT